ncbi:helix-turn-helix domain-containing protein [Trinickia caryophylli]|uniref:Transcriptional regulator, AraC family n=1 Tax=Trinickia caryophylli TaxID=28094 RepID=A0A1X7FLG4_TRICW|nr:helix-turn-helix domain-containing protein [Trinickia caryophylli]WQE13382.1 helix-turn-helix domain-containing protein [Trinickia caryophylli]GLU34099.1 AraC family transcriptional regulator [Trinickia caryophylli]SMF53664.1 transcriptional regulator, AraC family [Trinickia caryophylli]
MDTPLNPFLNADAASAEPPFGLHSVVRTLAEAQATLERFCWLGDHLALAEWRRETVEEETAYDRPGHHTLSCYIDGGYRTERQKLPGQYGAPERLCALPGEHESRWWVRGEMHFLHLYFLPEHFTRRAVHELDREPRELTLADRTYFEDIRIAALCHRLATSSWEGADARLAANETAHEILSQLLRSQAARRGDAPATGGLAPAVRRRLREYIDANLARTMTLGELAELACLSEYHFARMFRASFGMPPHTWIASERLERARTLLRTTTLSAEQIAAACGYADASHFAHRFRAALGAAPLAFRRATRA